MTFMLLIPHSIYETVCILRACLFIDVYSVYIALR